MESVYDFCFKRPIDCSDVSNFICGIGYGDPSFVFSRNHRLTFEEVGSLDLAVEQIGHDPLLGDERCL